MAVMICPWGGQRCIDPNCEQCAVRDRERNIRLINPSRFVFCTECVKVNECKIELYLDGCNEGVAYYDKYSLSE